MGPRLEIPKSVIGARVGAPCDRTIHKHSCGGVIPLLRVQRRGGEQADQGPGGTHTHRPAISRALATAATALAAWAFTACGDLTIPGLETLPTSELLILRLDGSAPAAGSATFSVSNAQGTVERLIHSDQFNTPFVELDFPAGSLASLGGTPLGPDDVVEVTVSAPSGQYGVTLSPSSLEFVSGREPTATFFYAEYGDASVADGSSRYDTRLEYLDALRVWDEISPGLWQTVSGSGPAGTDRVRGTLRQPGTFVVAARR